MYACACMQLLIRMHACMHQCTHACMHQCIDACMHAFINVVVLFCCLTFLLILFCCISTSSPRVHPNKRSVCTLKKLLFILSAFSSFLFVIVSICDAACIAAAAAVVAASASLR